jgi:hypothetical protein
MSCATPLPKNSKRQRKVLPITQKRKYLNRKKLKKNQKNPQYRNLSENDSIMHEAMENIVDSIESLLESAADYGKTSYELAKLKTIDQTFNVVSSLIPGAIVFLILMTFLLFLNLGVALWLGNISGNLFYGFFAVAAFYGIMALMVHSFMRGQIKKRILDYIIKQAFK